MGPKFVENPKKSLILQGARSSAVLNAVLTQIYHLKRDNAMRFTKKNDRVMPFESAECLIITFYDLVEVGVENFKTMKSFSYDEKIASRMGSKPFFALIGEGFESSGERKHLKEVLLDLFRGEVNKLSWPCLCVYRYLCKHRSLHALLHPAERSGTTIPRIELVEVGPSMDLVVRRHRLPNASLQKEAMKGAREPHKKPKNVVRDIVHGKIGKIYVPDQKRERREAKARGGASPDHPPKRQKASPGP
ncbi:unnamed protein product [Spirodela intermedia]|uniref:Ribosome production factor 2 homolog n=1 Tax=Spirodela intermedia TaxID=51605 RepID=A0A7I8KQ76_SPIIN|nr:unnamed protein product [Spirodela intermedia]